MPDAANLTPRSPPAAPSAASVPSPSDEPVARTLSLWAAIGYVLLVLLAAIALTFSIKPLSDSLDLSRLFR